MEGPNLAVALLEKSQVTLDRISHEKPFSLLIRRRHVFERAELRVIGQESRHASLQRKGVAPGDLFLDDLLPEKQLCPLSFQHAVGPLRSGKVRVAHGQIPRGQKPIDAFNKLLQKEDRRGGGSQILPAFALKMNAAGLAGKEVSLDDKTEVVNRMAGGLDEVDALRLSFGVRNEATPLDRLYGAIGLCEVAQGFLTPQP